MLVVLETRKFFLELLFLLLLEMYLILQLLIISVLGYCLKDYSSNNIGKSVEIVFFSGRYSC